MLNFLLNLIFGPLEPTPQPLTAFDEGYDAYFSKAPNPYAPDTEDYADFEAGWSEAEDRVHTLSGP